MAGGRDGVVSVQLDSLRISTGVKKKKAAG
jgi:hypothetical protein